MDEPKHCKITDYNTLPDGSLEITTKSYYERLAQLMQEIQANVDTTMHTLEQDVASQVKHFKDGSPKLILTLEMKNGQPRLTKKYVTLKKNFPRR